MQLPGTRLRDEQAALRRVATAVARGEWPDTSATIVREVASDRGVRIAKWLGDGCMIVAINQLDCIAFAIELEAKAREVCSPLSLRVGIATGHALLFEGDDYIGSAVNLASRLCDAAGANHAIWWKGA